MLIKRYLCGHKTTLEFTITDSNEERVVLSDKTIKLIVSKKPGETPVIEKDCNIVLEEEGKCDVILSSENTNIPEGKYYAQLSIIDNQQEKEATTFENDFQAIFLFMGSLI